MLIILGVPIFLNVYGNYTDAACQAERKALFLIHQEGIVKK